ncbi:hypothetical protein [Zhongshania aliphaticivorans]|uniref:hypothetical protein n=1 Tax=Zhongshania aliphaticivorans TaxID=1470434 RepID=UPI0012E53CAE|nr:hypothetical protein [Zhongshania aliphaticivorans]CAA0108679.1 Uncharacterised protein [Zhongshania aliphaticivorans]
MARQQSYMMWCLCVVLLSACAGHVENKRFDLDGQAAPVFSGEYKRDIFLQGEVTYGDTANTQFKGKFDSLGFPLQGELNQSYHDINNELLILSLRGDFSLNADESSLGFSGSFTIVDGENKVLAQGEQNHWQAQYSDLHRFRAPQLMAMEGDNQYLQYRRNISLKGRAEAYPVIHRGVAGPFQVVLSFREGLPRGIVKISAQNANEEFFVIERQYFNYQIEQQPVHYFYYEPGSFSKVELLGDCERAPNLTVPQHLLQAFAYNCDKSQFYALSSDYPASMLEISARDIDNGGLFHRVRIYRHGVITHAAVNVDAIDDGKWLYHGPVTVMHYGKLKSYRRYELGKPIGVGIYVDEQGAKYESFGHSDNAPGLPDDNFRDKLDSRYEWYKQRLNTRFSDVLSDSILSPSELSKLKSDLLEDIKENQPIVNDGQVAGLSGLWASWQRQSIAQLSTWGNDSNESVAVIKSRLLDDIEKWYEQSGALLLEESAQRCARGGKSFNEVDWRCEHRPNQALVKICEQYFTESQCAAMSKAFADRDGQAI